MLIHPRAALASGLAASAGAALLLLGRIDGSLLVAIALAVAARAAALGGSDAPGAARALSLLVRTIPAWVALAVIATVRAGSPLLADVWGANAVAGLGLARGDAPTVAGLWLVGLAALTAIAAPTVRGGPILLAPGDPWRRLELLAVAVQVPLVAGLLAGPQVGSAGDLVPWLVAAAVAFGIVGLMSTLSRRPESTARAALLLAAAGTVLGIIGAGP